MNNIVITILLIFSLFFFVVFLINTIIVYAQQQQVSPPPSSSNTPIQIPSQSSPPASPKLHAVKITSPTKSQQIPASKDLAISGTSIDNATSNCQVSMSVNHVRPYQPATAAGTGGANDYSKWNFVLTSNYTTIKPGPDNRITAKYTCTDNPVMVSPTYSSVNVTGVMDAASTSSTIAATTTAYAPPPPQQQQKQQTMTTSNNNETNTSNGNPNKITSAQDKPSSISLGTTAPVSTPTNTPDSGKLLYLGINSKSANKADNTKSAAHQDSNNDNSFATTTKIKTQHTSSSHNPIKTNTITNNIAEHQSITPSSSLKTKTSHSNDKSKDGRGVIDSEFGHSDPQSDALYHLFG